MPQLDKLAHTNLNKRLKRKRFIFTFLLEKEALKEKRYALSLILKRIIGEQMTHFKSSDL